MSDYANRNFLIRQQDGRKQESPDEESCGCSDGRKQESPDEETCGCSLRLIKKLRFYHSAFFCHREAVQPGLLFW